VRKVTVLSPHDLALLVLLIIVIVNWLNNKKIKSTKIILEKKHKKNCVGKTL
jgi:hypothetical protein